MQELVNINVGVLGHVDSGKTAIVAALSEVLSTAALDKHPQSQQRGITLDVGFSAFRVCLAAPGCLCVNCLQQVVLHARVLFIVVRGASCACAAAALLEHQDNAACCTGNAMRRHCRWCWHACVQVPCPEDLRDRLQTEQLQFTLVDCPGHASLIKTILVGAQVLVVVCHACPACCDLPCLATCALRLLAHKWPTRRGSAKLFSTHECAITPCS